MRRPRPLVLIVDDEPANLALLAKLLTYRKYDVIEAGDGESALEAVVEYEPDLVCLDVRMPGLDGIQVCQALRQKPEHAGLPILMLTGLQSPDDITRGLEAGANDFLSKPFNEGELSARIRSLLRSKALYDRLAEILGRYVSSTVATEVLRNPFEVAIGGGHCRVSTLFADVRGYTALAARHTPEQALDLLNHYLTLVADAVETRGGTVADLLGDGVFAFFGAPVSHDNDAERAVLAALEIQSAVMQVQVPSMPGVQLQTGIGITSGDVIAGNIGSQRRMHYAVVGESVNIAARLEAAAGPRQILIDEDTQATTRHLVVSQDLGSLRLAGQVDWIRAFNIVGLRT